MAGIDTANNIIKVFNSANNNHQVGSDILLGSRDTHEDGDGRCTCFRCVFTDRNNIH